MITDTGAADTDASTGPPRHIVVMGVSGTGKTTVGKRVAAELGATFVEGDALHPKANIDKMSAGHPLTDEDRAPWLAAIADEIRRIADAGGTSVTACSALRVTYRDQLRTGFPDLFFLHLQADYDTLLARMTRRKHFMPPSLLQSQFDTLEELAAGEHGTGIQDVDGIDTVVAAALEALGVRR
ncbi:gluconokinase [Rhodococcoides kroppenstedtii]|uniref:Gluconokinase n=1 Tax=Rhodococcoides kroppenstedtii TaxID=293050 RepID=A0A1I0T1P5_9NOCA|nr:gluconokinase [Rhodococcus kroppenstedtii]SFA45695.1 gluconokinase [Rhodococcus kroppenstedtii]